MKLSEIAPTLREIGVSPVKSLGQNFLHDRNLAKWIVDQANVDRKDFVFEIGPGLGALTELALAKGAHILAIEKDKRLVRFLREKFQSEALKMVHGDALEFDLRILYARPKVKLLGNLPYYISSQLLIKFIEYPSPISLWLFMLQKELAKRLVASPATRDYGALTLLVQLNHHVEYLRTIPASVFLPKPEVDSALVRISPRDPRELPACDQVVFEKLVRRGFAQRRKQLGKLIREELPKWEIAAAELGLNAKARAEELSLQQWIALSNYVAPIASGSSEAGQEESFSIVDEYDRVIGSAPRGQVHANNLLHRAVHLLIFNSAEDVFLQLRSRRKDRHPLLWDSSAAGHVEANEQYDETADRELDEELGVAAQLRPIGKLQASEKTGQEFIVVYHGEHNGPFRYPSEEISAVEFFPVDIINRWVANKPEDFAPGFLESWRLANANLA